MNCEEFSNGFDTAIDSYRRFVDFDSKEPLDTLEFNEYEKSVFLTQAQEDLVISLYSGRNPYGASFEETEELRRYLDELVKTTVISSFGSSDTIANGQVASLPSDLLFIVYEKGTLAEGGDCLTGKSIDIQPVTHDEFNVVNRNAFRGPGSTRALRLDMGESHVELVSKFKLASYIIRYISRPEPIVLTKLPSGVSIDGVSEAQSCKLNAVLHSYILGDAIRIALQSRGYSPKPSK